MFYATLKYVACICLFSLVVIGCESTITSDNQLANNSMIESSSISAESALAPETRKLLAGIKSATAAYHKVDKAMADGYAPAGGFVPGMGYHYVNFGQVDQTIDPYAPEALVYVPNPANDDKRRLVAVEYIYAGDSNLDTDLLDGLFPDIDGELWAFVPGVGWTFHAWIWYPNPEGVFNATNARVGDGS